jgi:hypothetical protein
MLENFERYFEAIELPDAMLARVMAICREVEPIIGGAPDHLFISDMYDEEKIRRHQSLWFVHGTRICEAPQFVTGDQVDFCDLNLGLRYMEINKEAFLSNRKASLESKLTVTAHFNGEAYMQLEGVSSNCSFLWEFITEVFSPHLGGPRSSARA